MNDDNKERPEIKERSLFFHDGFFDWLDVPRYYPRTCRIEQHPRFGWYIEFEMTHQEAAKMWAVLFEHHPEIAFNYDAEHGGQSFSERPGVTK